MAQPWHFVLLRESSIISTVYFFPWQCQSHGGKRKRLPLLLGYFDLECMPGVTKHREQTVTFKLAPLAVGAPSYVKYTHTQLEG